MWISEIELSNFRSFASANLKLSKGINLIVGPNNAGKSSLLKSISWLQQRSYLYSTDLRLSENNGFLSIYVNDCKSYFADIGNHPNKIVKLYLFSNKVIKLQIFDILKKDLNIIDDSQIVYKADFADSYCYSIESREPKNFIYPYLSKRKVSSYNETVNLEAASSIVGNFSNLYAKIDRLSNPQKPLHKEYIQACEDILGFPITATSSLNGKKAAYVVTDSEDIFLESMGEGIASLLGLIVDLCVADNKLFLIEEPENDVHPKALKKLLKLIAEKSQNNQFIITTHSNIVVKYLGSQPDTQLFRVTMEFEDRLPTSTVEEIGNSPEARLHLLEELGYEFFDFDIWSAWLILEESTAEKIIREYLIPWFAPELKGKIRTFSARSLSQVEGKFEAFNNLFVFLHLQPAYKNLAWVVIDGGEQEKEIIEKLKNNYRGWKEDHFLQFTEHDFERYYPQQFKDKVDSVLQMPKGKERQKGKNHLLEEVEKWILMNPVLAKNAFQKSASEVIEIIQKIEATICSEKNTKKSTEI